MFLFYRVLNILGITLRHKALWAVLFVFFTLNNIYSQIDASDKPRRDSVGFIIVNGYIEKNDNPLENASVTIYKNNKKLSSLRTPLNGKFKFLLDFNQFYKVEITKMGMVTKKFDFDTQIPIGVNRKQAFPFDFTIVLFPKYNYIDMKVLDKPLAVIRYDKQYEDFFYDYNYAKAINDKVIYIQNKIEELTKEYAKCVKDGKQLFDKKEYKLALIKFERAHEIFPDEPYPIEKIAAIKKIFNEKKTKKEIYNQLITDADEMYKQQEYEKAITLYGEALDVIPTEKYPAQRIRDTKKLMESLKVREQSYNDAIAKANKAFDYQKYQEAKKSYLEASAYFPNRQYPKDRIIECDRALGKFKDMRIAYNSYLSAADKLFLEKKFDEAIGPYSQAGKLFPEENYPRQRIEQINNILTDVSSTDDNYNKIIKDADRLFDEKNYSNAKLTYQKASNIKPLEQKPKERISVIDKLLADAVTTNKEYKSAINNADILYNKKKYEDAKLFYQQASNLRPEEVYPKNKIIEINNIINSQNLTEENYNQSIKQADKLFDLKNYSDAKQFYQVANKIKPEEKFPSERINIINKILNDIESQKSDYADYISKGDKYLKTELYEKAKDSYLKASNIFTDEKYPKEQIAQIEKILKQILLDEDNYQKAVKEADDLFSLSKYADALNSYKTALQYKPNDQHLKSRINQINTIIDDLRILEDNYKKTITNADNNFIAKKYREAKIAYQKASKMKPNEQYPITQISQIDMLLLSKAASEEAYKKAMEDGDMYYEAEKYNDALNFYREALSYISDQPEPKDKIARINKILEDLKTLDENYKKEISDADKFFELKDYQNAIIAYQNASNLKPVEQYPRDQVNEINRILGEYKVQSINYEKLILDADRFFNNRNYQSAKYKYQEALNINQNEEYPKNRIKEIDNIIASINSIQQAYDEAIRRGDEFYAQFDYENALPYYKKALEIKPFESYPANKIKDINEQLSLIKINNELYKVTITEADKQFTDKIYDRAKTLYIQALIVKPEETYPKKKINEINDILKQLQISQQSYDKIIRNADLLFNDKQYFSAKTFYKQATDIEPEKSWPKERIATIDKILNDDLSEMESYWKLIEEADNYFDLQDYNKARGSYMQASVVKPDDSYPRERVQQINDILSSKQSVQDSYLKLIVAADMAFSSKDYVKAKELFQKALEIIPGQKYPKEGIEKIDGIIKGFEINKKAYNMTVLSADDLYDQKKYKEARELYVKARELNPILEHPRERISEINNILRSEEYAKAIGEIKKELIENEKEKKFTFNPISDKKGQNTILIEIKNLSRKKFKIITNFGKDESTNGGSVIETIISDFPEKYLIRVGSMVNWNKINNNWIGLQPLGGDIEVHSIRIVEGR